MLSATDNRAQQFEFVKRLSRDLASGDICLPSFPAVVVKIRDMLEDEDTSLERLSKVVSADPVLVSKLFVYANSSFHNRSGENVTSLQSAISRLGLQLLRSTALSLAVQQLMLAESHRSIAAEVKRIWASSMRLAAMSHSIAALTPEVNEESAYLCGLLHQIGKLYILNRAKEFPDFLGDDASIREVQDEWHSQVGRSIVEAWEFPADVIQSMDPDEFFDEHTHLDPAPVDIVYSATSLLAIDEVNWPEQMGNAVWRKLKLSNQDLAAVAEGYRQKLAVVQESFA